MDRLSEEERAQILAQYEYFSQLFAKRNSISLEDLAESGKWVKAHRAYIESLKKGTTLSLIGFLLTCLFVVVAEGLRSWIKAVTIGH